MSLHSNKDFYKYIFDVENITTPPTTTLSPDDDFYLPNRIGFVNDITKKFKRYSQKEAQQKIDMDEDFEDVFEFHKSFADLSHPQKFVRDYMQAITPYRGLLLYHGLGFGKSAASIASAEMFLGARKCYIISQASLEANYIKEIERWGNELYSNTGKLAYYWKSISYETLKKYDLMENITIVDSDYKKKIKKNGRFWFIASSNSTNAKLYKDLDEKAQKEIDEQIKAIIRKKYHFLHFPNFSNKTKELLTQAKNPFDNSVVVIDEAHNLTNMIVNKDVDTEASQNIIDTKILYKRLFNAKNLKLLLLSATPIYNRPYELSKMINLLKGHTEIDTIFLSKELTPQQMKLLKYISDNYKHIDYALYNPEDRTIQCVFLPEGWVKTKSNKISYREDQKKSLKQIQGEFIKILKTKLDFPIKPNTTQFAKKAEWILPNTEDSFNQMFVNKDQNKIKNKNLFQRRIMGAVSYVPSLKDENSAKITKHEIVKVHMSDEQYLDYKIYRQEEKRKERSALTRAGTGDNESVKTTFKSDTRLICNFVFPANIPRPTLKKIRLAHSVVSTDTSKKVIEDIYEKELKQAITKLAKTANKHLTIKGGNLVKYSPKFESVIKNINSSKGNNLVYTTYRNVEGLGVFKLALLANGFAEVRLHYKDGNWEIMPIAKEDLKKPKFVEYGVSTYTREANEIIRNLYNGEFDKINQKFMKQVYKIFDTSADKITNLRGELIKVFMITASGAEGISLYNVRKVHIIEPHWNYVRNQQVIGRATRMGSHKNLPPKERTVEIYEYLITFDPKKIKSGEHKPLDPNNATTDELLYNLSIEKKELNEPFLELLKATAVDCKLGAHNIKCYTEKYIEDKDDADLLIHPSLDREERDADINKIFALPKIAKAHQKQDGGGKLGKTSKSKKLKPKPIDTVATTTAIVIFNKSNMTPYIAYKNKVFDYNKYVNNNEFSLVGFI